MSMTDVSDQSGWHEVEQTLTALELPPIPPTSDPQRLLGYVLHILPRYTEMEMLATHFRLYASTLEQDMEQIKSHVKLLTREALGEREKKDFLERYAAQIVKERNDLLHSRGSSKKKTAAGVSHFVWHNCCKKNSSHAMDLAPSISAFRGEKLQEATKQIEVLQEEVHNQELLRKELDYLLKRTQREHDSKIAADRKCIQQLEKQVVQRSALHSSLERKLFEVETMLARHDQTKEEEFRDVYHRLEEVQTDNARLKKESILLHEKVELITSDRCRLLGMLEETTETKNACAEQVENLTKKCRSLESEVEALRSEIGMLQNMETSDVCLQYTARIDKLQKEHYRSEKMLRQEVDRLKQEIRKRDESLVQTLSAHQSITRVVSDRTSTAESNIVSADDVQRKYGNFDDDCRYESDKARSSLSRSQLSVAHDYSDLSVAHKDSKLSSWAGQNYFDLSKEARIVNESHIARKQGHISCQSHSRSSKHENSWDIDAFSRCSSSPSKSYENGDNTTEKFDWETFIDSASDISSFPNSNDQTKFFPSAIPRPIDFSTSSIDCENSMMKTSDSALAKNRADSLAVERDEFISNSADVDEIVTFYESPSFIRDNESEDEEEKKSEIGGKCVSNEPKQHDRNGEIDSKSVRNERNYENIESLKYGVPVQNDLVQDLSQMLNGLELKRRKEEQKASQAERALLEYQQLQQGLQAVNMFPCSS